MRMEESRQKNMARIAARVEKRKKMYKSKTSEDKKEKKSTEKKSADVVNVDVAGSARVKQDGAR